MTRLVASVGCRGVVPDGDGPIHRYMTASPGCWRIHAELGAGGFPASPRSPLTVDAYAVTHPGVPGPQSTPSVWVHLVTLCAVLESDNGSCVTGCVTGQPTRQSRQTCQRS